MVRPQLESYHRRAFVLIGFKGVLLCLIGGFLIYEIVRSAVYYEYYRNVWELLGRQMFPLLFAGMLVILVAEIGMMILLVKAVVQKSFFKSRLWVSLSFAFFGVRLIVFCFEANANSWAVSDTLLLIGLFFDLIAIKIMYDFMAKVRNLRSSGSSHPPPPPPVPRSQPPTSLPPNVEIPMTTFKMNNLSDNPYRPTTTTASQKVNPTPTHQYGTGNSTIAPWNVDIAAQLRSKSSENIFDGRN